LPGNDRKRQPGFACRAWRGPELRGIRCGGHLAVAYDRAVDSSLIVRPARVQDVRQMARVHVRCWQETYRGLMPDAVLDDPGFPAARERMWTEVL
jgi:hypothetical protein